MSHDHGGHCCSAHGAANPSVFQTLDELDFERGVWSAALNGEVDKVQKYLDGGGCPDSPDSSGYTALHYGARNGRLAVCQLLVNHGADVNVQTRSGGVTPLHRACYRGDGAIVNLLLQHKARADLTDTDGMTALHKAAEGGHVTLCEALANRDQSLVSLKGKRGRTAYDCVPNNKKNLFKFLTVKTS